MAFLAIIVAVLLLQAWGTAERVHHDTWYANWSSRVDSWGLGDGLSLALLVLLPALLAQLVLNLLEPVLFGLLWLAAAVFLLLYSFGRGEFQASMGRYRGYAFSGDFEAAYLAACEQFGWDQSDPAPESPQQVHAMIQRALLYEGFQRWFGVIFYFLVLGPAGALIYRLSQLRRESSQAGLAQSWQFLLDWVPARLLVATFALTGDFIGCREKLLAALREGAQDAADLIYSVGAAALGQDAHSSADEDVVFGPEAAAQNREFDALLSRSAVCWIVVLSLLVVFF